VSAILVIGNTGDPVTGYQNSVAMARELARARLLTVDGFGHTEFFNPSTCASSYEFRYLTTGPAAAGNGVPANRSAVPVIIPLGCPAPSPLAIQPASAMRPTVSGRGLRT
jgi:TAP-like protein